MARRGLFITFEGVEGSGKTTQVRLLARRLRREGIRPLVSREPGGTPLGDALRRVLLDPASAGMPPLVELLLYSAARADHVQRKILPALERGRVVLCDRYLGATLAYQGFGRGLPIGLIRQIHSTGPLALRPDLTILLDLPVEKGLTRAKRRDGTARARVEGRFEAESLVFHYLVATGYRRLARSERAWRVVDASGPQQEVAEKIARAVLPRVKRLRGARRPAGPRTRPRKTRSSGATRRRR